MKNLNPIFPVVSLYFERKKRASVSSVGVFQSVSLCLHVPVGVSDEEDQKPVRLPLKVAVELQPRSNHSWARVQSLAHNPRLRSGIRLTNLSGASHRNTLSKVYHKILQKCIHAASKNCFEKSKSLVLSECL